MTAADQLKRDFNQKVPFLYQSTPLHPKGFYKS